jgi:glucose/arabinose dehydrogenase
VIFGLFGTGRRRVGGPPRPRAPPPSRSRTTVLLLAAALVATACGSETQVRREPTQSASPSTSPPTESPSASPSPRTNLDDARVDLEQIATLQQPLALAVREGDPALYIAEKVGRIVALEDGGEPRVVLDLTGEVSLGSEQGLLGLAFSPDGAFLYVNYTDTSGHTHVTEFAVDDGDVDVNSRREVLFVEQPFSNHNGGNLVFGPDGFLYIGLGDGGSAGDPQGNGQSLSTLLGKMLRISPRSSGKDPYGVPRDNPFVGRARTRPEIWSYGLRNPWRYSFDRETGDLWIGDVGQGSREEVDVELAGSRGGLNFGWDRLEGTLSFEGAEAPENAVPPVYEYPTADGCAVTGGYVYRGSEIPELVGAYVFGDFCHGRLEAFVLRDGTAEQHRELGLVVENLASFGEDAAGELYVLSLSGPVFRIVPA